MTAARLKRMGVTAGFPGLLLQITRVLLARLPDFFFCQTLV
jgi:hypothetical protein